MTVSLDSILRWTMHKIHDQQTEVVSFLSQKNLPKGIVRSFLVQPFLTFGIMVGFSVQSICMAQLNQTSPNQAAPAKAMPTNNSSNDQSKLTEGLLDLLGDPQPDNSKNGLKPMPSSSQPRSNAPSPEKKGMQPPSTGSKPTNEVSQNPLTTIRQNMQQAANLLQQGRDQQSLPIQNDIVTSLDELITMLEQQDKSEQRSTSKQKQNQRSQPSQQSQSSTESQQRADQSSGSKSQSQSDDAAQEAGQVSNSPGMSGQRASTDVQAKDSAALQQSVWGHLPSRVRSQMQSRMVEEFLPSYREKIEAYYRAMLEERELP